MAIKALLLLVTLAPSLAVDWNFSLDLFSGETGYFKVEGYEGVQPTLTLQLGTDYWLHQTHASNWMHPIGLAYQPNGAHDVLYPGSEGEGAPEVADGSGTTGYEYVYYIKYPGETDFTAVTLDDYEPLFFYPINEWAKHSFKIHLRVTEPTFAKSIVYFCHIHNMMSGLISIEGGSGSEVSNLDAPAQADAFDVGCGTWGASSFRDQCPGHQFLCGEGLETPFAQCMNAIDCKMYVEMQTLFVEPDYVTTFMHQMIPHHLNAVNMARILLKKSKNYGDDSVGVDITESEPGAHDGFEDMLLDMVSGQNYQISEMRKWLLEQGKNESSSCRRLESEAGVGLPLGLQSLPSSFSGSRRMAARPSARHSAAPRSLQDATWDFSVDLFTGETGYFRVAGYEGVQPALTLELNKTYAISQANVTNWMHPIGLAFQPDGAHDVLYPGSAGEGAPEVADGNGTAGYEYVYYVKYPGEAEFRAVTLDDYEPLFFYPLSEWVKYSFKIHLRVTDPNFAQSILYFCHIHNKMSGKITIQGGTGENVVQDLYAPTTPAAFDQQCGTTSTAPYAAGMDSFCPSRTFLCGAEASVFVDCMNAIDCKMHHEMQVANVDSNPVVTFMHQMIPHHINAVNMARILLKKTSTYGDNSVGVDITESEPDARDGFEDMLLAMINTQNYQISEMRKWLLENSFLEAGSCSNTTAASSDATAASNATTAASSAATTAPSSTSSSMTVSSSLGLWPSGWLMILIGLVLRDVSQRSACV